MPPPFMIAAEMRSRPIDEAADEQAETRRSEERWTARPRRADAGESSSARRRPSSAAACRAAARRTAARRGNGRAGGRQPAFDLRRPRECVRRQGRAVRQLPRPDGAAKRDACRRHASTLDGLRASQIEVPEGRCGRGPRGRCRSGASVRHVAGGSRRRRRALRFVRSRQPRTQMLFELVRRARPALASDSRPPPTARGKGRGSTSAPAP